MNPGALPEELCNTDSMVNDDVDNSSVFPYFCDQVFLARCVWSRLAQFAALLALTAAPTPPCPSAPPHGSRDSDDNSEGEGEGEGGRGCAGRARGYGGEEQCACVSLMRDGAWTVPIRVVPHTRHLWHTAVAALLSPSAAPRYGIETVAPRIAQVAHPACLLPAHRETERES